MALLKRLTTKVPRYARALAAAPYDELDITFNSARDAFKSKKTSELVRAYVVYTLFSINFLVEKNDLILKQLRRYGGKYIFEFCLKSTFYGQFVAGEDQEKIRPTVERLRSFGVKPCLDYSVEEDLTKEEAEKREVSASTPQAGDKKEEGQLKQYHVEQRFADRRYKVTSARTYFYLNEATCERNMEAFFKTIDAVKAIEEFQCTPFAIVIIPEALAKMHTSISTSLVASPFPHDENLVEAEKDKLSKYHDLAHDVTAMWDVDPDMLATTQSTGLAAVKLTALGRPQLLLQLSEVIMRARNYMAQIAGSKGSTAVTAHKKTVEDLNRYFGENSSKPEVQTFMKQITRDKEGGIVHLFPWSDILDKDMGLSDTFRVPDPKTGQMRRLISQISKNEETMFRNMLRRLVAVIDRSDKANVRLMIDAEQTYFQPAISRICLEMQHRFNKEKCLVFNTYQTYLKNTYNEVVADLEQAERQKFYWGAKLVRGAYIEQERARAKEMGYDDPTCMNVEATTASYHKCLEEVLDWLQGKKKKDSFLTGKVAVMVASHNEDTVRHAIKLMRQLNIKPKDKVVCFGQLLGMCDHVTFPLGQSGYSAYKYVPYGPVDEVIPYLSRRAHENRGFLSKIKKEKRLLVKEIFRRVVSGQMFYKPVGNYVPV